MKKIKLPVLIMKDATYEASLEAAETMGMAAGTVDATSVAVVLGTGVVVVKGVSWGIKKISHKLVSHHTEKKLDKIYGTNFTATNASNN